MKGKSFSSYSFGDVNQAEDCHTIIRDIKFMKINRKHTESLATEEQNDDAKYQEAISRSMSLAQDCRIRLLFIQILKLTKRKLITRGG
jgi:hypothetical protein